MERINVSLELQTQRKRALRAKAKINNSQEMDQANWFCHHQVLNRGISETCVSKSGKKEIREGRVGALAGSGERGTIWGNLSKCCLVFLKVGEVP